MDWAWRAIRGRGVVDLEHIARYFSNKMHLLRENKGLQFWMCALMAKHTEVRRTKERTVFYKRKGELERLS